VLPSQSDGKWHVPLLANGSHLSSLTQFALRERRTGGHIQPDYHDAGTFWISSADNPIPREIFPIGPICFAFSDHVIILLVDATPAVIMKLDC
jgi:hypothetical protein